MAHRNEFTWLYLLKHGDFPWQTVSHNQMEKFSHRLSMEVSGASAT
jgi:hypothetical protein